MHEYTHLAATCQYVVAPLYLFLMKFLIDDKNTVVLYILYDIIYNKFDHFRKA